MRMVFLGPPGAGKGTVAGRVCERKGWSHLSSGNILRAEAEAGSRLGARAKRYMDAGQLVPDELVVDMMVQRIARDDCDRGFVLDGFPRTDMQAEALDRALARDGRPLDVVILLHCPDEVVVQRIAGRRSCPQCGAVYHVRTMPPEVPDVCDRCGHEGLTQRDDDKEEVVARRLAAYREQTEPLIGYYCRQGLLERVDGTREVQAVCDQVQDVLDRRGQEVRG